jgi:two-component system sensor histidine kinase BaeS
LLVAIALLVAASSIFLVGIVEIVLRLAELPRPLGWALPVAGILLLIGLVALAWLGRGVRHLSRPLGDLLDAADRVADGDYSARVAEQGPREVRSVARAFNTMASRLQAADERRRLYLSSVTHELRTPLTVIQGNLEGMLDGVYAPDQARLKLVLEESQVLSRLVDDLRISVLVESGSLVLRRQPTDLVELLHEVAVAFRTQANGAGVTIDVDAPQEIPLLPLDPERMRQVLLNLVANAVRYTPPRGSVVLRCRATEKTTGKSAVIEVQDTGSGITGEDLPHVFDPFYKTRDSRGMGLGLSIAKSIVEAHRGTITARSDFGQGTTISVILPLDE